MVCSHYIQAASSRGAQGTFLGLALPTYDANHNVYTVSIMHTRERLSLPRRLRPSLPKTWALGVSSIQINSSLVKLTPIFTRHPIIVLFARGQPMWRSIEDLSPDVWLWIGDAVYVDKFSDGNVDKVSAGTRRPYLAVLSPWRSSFLRSVCSLATCWGSAQDFGKYSV